MSETKSSSSTISMKGGGYYYLHTRGAKDVIDNTAPLALAAVGRIDVAQSKRPFAIADFGAADGGTSVDLVRRLVGSVREKAPHRPIAITYTDLPRNDFSALFAMVHGDHPEITSYLDEHSNVYVYASGTTFYRQIFPDQTLDFGFSATAMHWLSGSPGPISDHVHAVGTKGNEYRTYHDYAMRDWETILMHRARELVSGGRLVMANFCVDEDGRYLGNTGGVNMFDTFNELWHALVDDGTITEQEYRSTAFPQFYKTVADYCAPLVDPSNPVYRAGLRLESTETRIVGCPYAAKYRQTGDVEHFAVSYVPTLRSWSETVFFNSLDKDRTIEERREIVDRFYDSYIDRVRLDPDRHSMDYVHIYMTVSKQ